MTATLLKLDLYYRETTTQCFLMNFVKLLRTPFWKMFWKNTSGRLYEMIYHIFKLFFEEQHLSNHHCTETFWY